MLYPIPPRNSAGKDDTAYWEGFFSEEELNTILSLSEWHQPQEAIVGALKSEVVDKNIRRSQVSWLYVTPETEWIWSRVAKTIAEVNRTFFRLDLTGCYEPMQLSMYKHSNEGFYDWHVDASPYSKHVPRKLSMSLLLSDPSEFEGGDLQAQLSNETKTLENKKGRAWFFPSYVLHRVTPVTKGIRRSLVLWVGGPEFK